MAGWAHGLCMIVCGFVLPRRGYSLSPFCDHLKGDRSNALMQSIVQ